MQNKVGVSNAYFMEPALHRPQTLKPRRKSVERSRKAAQHHFWHGVSSPADIKLATAQIEGVCEFWERVRLFEWKDKEGKEEENLSSSIGRNLKGSGAERGAPGNLSGDWAFSRQRAHLHLLSYQPCHVSLRSSCLYNWMIIWALDLDLGQWGLLPVPAAWHCVVVLAPAAPLRVFLDRWFTETAGFTRRLPKMRREAQ